MNEPVRIPPAQHVEMRRNKDGKVRPQIVGGSRSRTGVAPVSTPSVTLRLSAKETSVAGGWMAPCPGLVSSLTIRAAFATGEKLLTQAEVNGEGGTYFDVLGGVNTPDGDVRVERGDILSLRVTALADVSATLHVAFLFEAD